MSSYVKPKNPYAIGDNIVTACKSNRISLGTLAADVGVPYTTLGYWCRGLSTVPAYNLYLIAKRLGVTVEQLLEGCDG